MWVCKSSIINNCQSGGEQLKQINWLFWSKKIQSPYFRQAAAHYSLSLFSDQKNVLVPGIFPIRKPSSLSGKTRNILETFKPFVAEVIDT